ncbi:ATP-binding protein [Flagellimonas sp. MMG031]|uniref:histidine kinase n=1 Tax=Flagellimonas sp. MMG031 TaxID=3158549 RepID=A0AAU7N0S0_9FLAO
MEKFNGKWLVYLIAIVIGATICIQVYWNYKSYLTNKQQLINEVQIGLDNAVNSYYETLAQRNTVNIVLNSAGAKDFSEGNGVFDSLIQRIDMSSKGFRGLDSITKDRSDKFTLFRGTMPDSLPKFALPVSDTHKQVHENDSTGSLIIGDTIKPLTFDLLTSKVILSITQDSLEMGVMDSLFTNELERKKIQIPYGLMLTPETGKEMKYHPEIIQTAALSTTSRSTFLPKGSKLEVFFPDVQALVLKRILGGILLSTILVLAVIGSLFYLMATINKQKQLAELKNDFISNITHEFKTPIATIHAALEGITDFDVLKDPEKAKSYVGMSKDQLAKLNLMVEKLLETASFDQHGPILNKREADLVPVLRQLSENHQLNTSKSITLKSEAKEAFAPIDALHFENALNNVLDNAVKYGGDHIQLFLKKTKSSIEITIQDNGTSLKLSDKDKIFDKFHRVPQGNVHNVKGYGIGLYHTKKIIQAHGGDITLHLGKNQTAFKIVIPYV